MAALRAEFVAGLPERAREVEAWLASGGGDSAALARLCHRLRGVAPTHGLVELGALAGRIEDAVKGGRAHEVRADVPRLLAAMRAAEGAMAPDVPTDTTGLRGLRIVAIDDDLAMRRLLAITLIDLGGADAEVVETEGALREALARRPVDLVIADVMMPHKTGPALLEELSAAGLLGPAKVVVLSASGRGELAVASAAWRWMAKPFRPPELVAALRAVVGRPPM